MADRIRHIHFDTLSCEPLLRRMPNGELLCVSQCGDTYEPAPGNRVLAFRSGDNGETWSPGESVHPENGKAVYATEMHQIGDTLKVFAQVHDGRFLNMECVEMQSRDSGYTWQRAEMPENFPRSCFIRSMIRLKSGRILVPYQAFPITEEENARIVIANHQVADVRFQQGLWDLRGPAVLDTGVMISDDGGLHYRRVEGPQVPIKGEGQPHWVWTEPTLAELSDGRIVMMVRLCASGWLWQCESRDGGESWSPLVNTGIPSPSCKPRLIGIPDGRIVLLHTPSQTIRFPFEMWISRDDMATWGEKRRITDFPGTYHYPDGFYEDGRLLFTVEHNRRDILFFDFAL